MSELAKILCVDDEPQVLDGLRANLRRRFQVATAGGGEEGLRQIESAGPFQVVVSDMRMPGMDGAHFLARVRELAPDTVRILLTGHADLDSAIAAVNEGQIFRFLTKPCPAPQLVSVLESAARQYQLVTAERELLEKTLRGSIQALVEVLSLAQPTAYGRAARVKDRVSALCLKLGVSESWPLEIAALLSPIGAVALPDEVVEKMAQGKPLDEREREQVAHLPEIAERLLQRIPRLEPVREILRYQARAFTPQDGLPPAGKAIPLGARMLKLLQDLDELETQGLLPAQALDILQGRAGQYDPELLHPLGEVVDRARRDMVVREVLLDQLREGMLIAADVKSVRDTLIIARGNEVTLSLLARMRNLPKGFIREPVRVLIRG
ncbi:MAG: response regulator [Myxococcales bacterium]|nr:response regulator [Myxococcales bacterium]